MCFDFYSVRPSLSCGKIRCCITFFSPSRIASLFFPSSQPPTSSFFSWASPPIYPSVPTLICHEIVVYESSAFQSLHSSFTSHPPSPTQPLLVLKAQSMMTLLSNTFSPSSHLPPPIHPSIPPVPLQLLPLPSPSFISPQSPAVLVSVSELSPPRTWRPRSPAPRKGSELQHRKEELGRDAASYRTPQTATHFLSCSFMRLLSSDQARTWTHKLCLNPPKAGYTHTHTHVHTLPCSSISESIFAR